MPADPHRDAQYQCASSCLLQDFSDGPSSRHSKPLSMAITFCGGAHSQAAHLRRAFRCAVRGLAAVRCQVNAAIRIRSIAGLCDDSRAATAAVLTAYAEDSSPHQAQGCQVQALPHGLPEAGAPQHALLEGMPV